MLMNWDLNSLPSLHRPDHYMYHFHSRKKVRQTEPTSCAVISSPCFFGSQPLLHPIYLRYECLHRLIDRNLYFEGRVALKLKEILSIYLKRAEHPLISEERNLSEYYCALTMKTMWKYPSEKADLFTSSDSLTIIHFPLYRVPLFILL